MASLEKLQLDYNIKTPTELNNSLKVLRREWKKSQGMRDVSDLRFKQLRAYIRFLISTHNVANKTIADTLHISEARISVIANQNRKDGDTT